MTRLSNDNLHATTVCKGERAVLLMGPSGSGKSDLALQHNDRANILVRTRFSDKNRPATKSA